MSLLLTRPEVNPDSITSFDLDETFYFSSVPFKRPLLKRLFDISFSLVVLILFSPIYLLIALLIKIFSPDGPIFYGQKRIGRGGQYFRCYKFRTMLPNADRILWDILSQNPEMRKEYEYDFKLKNDPRIIPVIGHLLRKTSLDELPQFFNALIGNMSIIGPRPIVQGEVSKYGRQARRLFSVKPGLSGLWQVSGRNDLPYHIRVALDVYYARRHNLLLDFQIIMRTLYVMLFQHGAY